MMFEVKPITIDQAQDLIRKYKLNYFWNKGYEGTKYEFAYKGDKYEWYGVFEEDVLVAVQVLERIDDNNLFLTSLQKIPGTGHGVFEAVMNYFSNYTLQFKAYDDKLRKMYKKLGFIQSGNYDFKKNPNELCIQTNSNKDHITPSQNGKEQECV